ncbi:hypothetical protein ACFE04_003919 [Oxalis oulophora]
MLDKSIREIERERQGLQNQEKKLIVEIKKNAKQGQMGAVKVMAKDLIRTRHQIEKFYKLKSQLQGVSLRIQTLKSTHAMGEAMKGVTKAMGQMNRQMNLPSLQKIMREFEMQNEKMELVSEVMGDAIDDALGDDEEEEETELLVSQVLDEIGIDINQELVNAPSSSVAAPAVTNKVPQAESAGAAGNHDNGGIDDDLQAREDCVFYSNSDLFFMDGDMFSSFSNGRGGGAQVDTKVLQTFQKSFVQVQGILDQNRVLINEINQNHETKIPDNLNRNVGLIRELNNNIRRVVDLYADLSTNFTRSAEASSEGESAGTYKSDGKANQKRGRSG